jgi:phosphatidylglycerophosphate synthase
VITADAAAVAGVAAVSLLLVRTGLPLSAAYPLASSALLAAILTLALGHVDPFHPYRRFGAANYVTTVRISLVAIVAALINEASVSTLAGVAVAASLIVTALDGVDGWLSRRTSIVSAFGARFDMETDALLIQVLSILAWRYGKAGAWVVLSGLLRYLFVMAGWIWAWMQQPLFPSFRRKLICVVQMVGLMVTVAPFVPPRLSEPVAAISLAILGYSFLVDTLWLWRHRRAAVPHREHRLSPSA